MPTWDLWHVVRVFFVWVRLAAAVVASIVVVVSATAAVIAVLSLCARVTTNSRMIHGTYKGPPIL